MSTRRLTWITAVTSALSLALAALATPAWAVQTPGGQSDSDCPQGWFCGYDGFGGAGKFLQITGKCDSIYDLRRNHNERLLSSQTNHLDNGRTVQLVRYRGGKPEVYFWLGAPTIGAVNLPPEVDNTAEGLQFGCPHG